jgi:hypothetical protein
MEYGYLRMKRCGEYLDLIERGSNRKIEMSFVICILKHIWRRTK